MQTDIMKNVAKHQKKIILSVLCSIAIMQASFAQTKLTKDQTSLIQAEQNFAATAVSQNIKTAFMKVLDERSIVFRPHPMNGRWAYYIDARPDSTYLNWQPEFVDISAGGDFGYSTGPWYSRRSKFNEEGRKGFGNFVTVWKKDKDGTWHVLIDKGVNYSNAGERQTGLAGGIKGTVAKKNVDIAEVLSVDAKAFAGKEITYYTTSTLLMQHRKWPFHIAADSLLTEYKNYESWEPIDGCVAPYGDMAYTYGKFNGYINGKKQDGYYLRIWKREEKDEWKIVLDLRTEN